MSDSSTNLLDAAIEIKNVSDLVGNYSASSPINQRHGRIKLKTFRRARAAANEANRSFYPRRETQPVRVARQPNALAFGSRARQLLAEAYAVVSLLAVIGLLLYEIIA